MIYGGFHILLAGGLMAIGSSMLSKKDDEPGEEAEAEKAGSKSGWFRGLGGPTPMLEPARGEE